MSSDDAGRVDDALRVLALVGAPAELLGRVLALALEDEIGASEARGLVISWPDRAVDARLASEMALALAGRDWTRLRYAAWMALERGAPAARVIAQRVLEVAEHDPDALDAAVECARRLRDAGALDEGVGARGARPPRVAHLRGRSARLAPRREHPARARGGAVVDGSRWGLGGAGGDLAPARGAGTEPARSPARAILDVGGRRSQRAELVHAMCMHGAPLAVVAPHLDELLVSADPNVSGALVGVARVAQISEGPCTAALRSCRGWSISICAPTSKRP